MLMSAQSWLVRNASLESAHDKYGDEFELAYHHFRQGVGSGDRHALWNDYENVGENIMSWYLQRKC